MMSIMCWLYTIICHHHHHHHIVMFEDNDDDDDGSLKKAPPAVSSHRWSRPTRSRHFHICNHASSITSRRSHAIDKILNFFGVTLLLVAGLMSPIEAILLASLEAMLIAMLLAML